MIPDPNSRLFDRLRKPEFRIGLGLGFALSGGGARPDYIIDKANGSDSNTGTSDAQAWATLSKIGSIALAAGSTKRVLIKAGTYDSANDYVERSDATSGGNIGLNALLVLTFEPGVTMDGTVANASAEKNAFEFSGTNSWTTRVYGNGLTVQHYNYNTGGASPNGFGNRNTHTLLVYDAHVVDCVDGFSAHGSATLKVYDCSASGGTKSSYAHVENARFEAYRSTFTGASGATLGIGSVASTTATALLEDCVLVPASSGQSLGMDGTTFRRCRIGTLSASVTFDSQYTTGCTVEDSFLNAYVDGNKTATITRCYGRFSVRVRNGGAVNVQHSVFSNPASSQTAIIFSNFNPGANAKIVFKNNIVETATAAAFMNVDSTNAGYLVGGASEFNNNVLSGSAAFDADLITADSGGTVRAGSISADALIGAANTLDPDDYGYGPGSPAIGAGTGGTNSGFAIGEVPPVG